MADDQAPIDQDRLKGMPLGQLMRMMLDQCGIDMNWKPVARRRVMDVPRFATSVEAPLGSATYPLICLFL